MKLSTVLSNSLKSMGVESGKIEDINESTTSADISTFASQVGALIKKKYKTSLAYEIAEVQPLNTSIGKIFALTKTNTSGNTWKFVIADTPVTAVTKKADTGFTNEAWQDINAIYGEDATDVCSNILAKVSGAIETSDVIEMCKNNSTDIGAIVAQSYEHVFTQIGNAISKMNQVSFRTMEAFAIVPSSLAGNFIVDPNYFVSDSLNTSSMYLQYKFGKTRIYVNPDTTDNNVYVGLNGTEPGTSSIIFSPYQYTISPATDPDTGITNLFVFNRYGITMNPLHTVAEPMLYKFAVTMPFAV